MPITGRESRFQPPRADRELWNPEAQTLAEDRLAKLQEDGIAREWARVWEHPIPFYADRYRAAGLGPDSVPDLDDVPLTTKAELRANEAEHPPFGTHRTVALEQALRVGRSTGTTGGRPVYILMGPGDLDVAVELQCRATWACGVRPGDRFAHAWPYGMYVSSGTSAFWYVETGVLELAMGPPENDAIAADHVRLWEEFRPRGFMITNSQLEAYEGAAAELGIDLGEIFAGTTVVLFDLLYQFEEPRRRVEERFGFRIRNMAGAADIPGFGCPDCDHRAGNHVPGDVIKLQVVDPATGRSVADGERGHLVVTAFGMDSFFFRYDLEDIAVLESGPCACGQTGQRFRVLGREADAIEVAGRQVLPLDVQLALDPHGAPEFRLAGDGPADRLALRVECDGDPGRYAELLGAELGFPVEAEAVAPGSLPRSSFKPRRVEEVSS